MARRARISQAAESTPAATTPPGGSQGVLFNDQAHSRPPAAPPALTEAHLTDRPPLAHRALHRLTETERSEILNAADEDAPAHLRHRKLTHHMSRQGRVFCSEPSVLRVLREGGKVPVYLRRRRRRPRPEIDAQGSQPLMDLRPAHVPHPRRELPPGSGARRVVPRDHRPVLRPGGHVGVRPGGVGQVPRQRRPARRGRTPPARGALRPGTQMTSRSTQSFFADLGIAQSFSRPRTPTDNAACESWMATLNVRAPLRGRHRGTAPVGVEELIDRFIDYYNNERLHQGIGFVTPAERHEGP